MSVQSIQLGLRVGAGRPGPAPASLLRALRAVEVSQSDSGPTGFQLTFHAEIDDAAGGDFAVAADPLLQPFQRVLVTVSVDGAPATTVVDGFITHHQFQPASGPDESSFVVTGEDVSVAMDVVDYSREFPALPDGLIVLAVLAPWTLLGLVPDIPVNVNSLVPYDHVPQQSGTDRQTVQQLAQQNGFVFYVRPAATLFENTAYWGPPPRSGDPVAVLDVATGPFSTVDSIQFEYDSLAPKTYFGLVMETTVEPYLPVPLLTMTSTRQPVFATQPALTPESLLSLQVRKELWRQSELDPVRAIAVAQGLTDASTDAVVKGTCEVDALRLGTVVSAPGVVGVRGAGTSYDGLYYLQSATHRVSLGQDGQWDYKQTLVITREGVGTTTTSLEPR